MPDHPTRYEIGDRVVIKTSYAGFQPCGSIIETVEPLYRDQPQRLCVWLDNGIRRVFSASDVRPL